MSVSTFGLAKNLVRTTLASAHVALDGQLVLAPGAGAILGALPANRIYRVAAVLNPGTLSESIAGIFEATGLSTDTLTGVTAAEGSTDVGLVSGTAIRVRDTAKYFSELQAAVNAIESDATLVRTTVSYSDPPWILSLAASKITGTKLSIGDTIGSGTAGSVPFLGASGVLSQDNASLFWDAVHKRLGVGTTAPSMPLDVNGNANVEGQLVAQSIQITFGGINPGTDDAFSIGGTSQRWTSLDIGSGGIRSTGGIFGSASASGNLTLQSTSHATKGTIFVGASGGSCSIASTTIGLYGVTPVTRQLLATGAGHTVDDVITALQTIGLCRQS